MNMALSRLNQIQYKVFLTEHKAMFQPKRMNQIDNFFMRNNNQVTPKRSHSPLLNPHVQQIPKQCTNPQYFPSNKENFVSNRTSVSPSKMNFVRKPMISGPGSKGRAPSLLVSPRNKPSRQGFNIIKNQGRPQLNAKPQNNGVAGLLKRFNQNGSDVQFVMSKRAEYCQNHGNKIAEFTINIEGQKMKYCSVCASKLASQGFTVTRIANQSQKSLTQSQHKPKPLPSYPQYRGNQFYQQITQFLRQLISVQSQHYQTITKFNSLDKHYNTQTQMITQYYDEVIRILSEMKEQHLQDLTEEKQRYLQIGDIQCDYLKQNVEEIVYMREDIETNIPSIVTDIEEDSFRQCIYEYRQKMAMLKHSIQQKQQAYNDVTYYQEQQLRRKVQDFQNAMKLLWKEQSDQQPRPSSNYPKLRIKDGVNDGCLQQQEPVSVRNMHNMLPKASVQQTQGQGAFRHLFGDDESNDETLPVPSPQFKKI